jgi:hypothetical protein
MKNYRLMCYMGMQYSIIYVLANSQVDAIEKALRVNGVVSASIW